ncbi:MAG: protein YebE [Kangiellaceae bacterium]|nr:protein YebE [Kangiellaceae bacterium]|tara:strand:- start:3493 stop:4224 length:732 start_codon:yes stop_codon:yes gene_type:complete
MDFSKILGSLSSQGSQLKSLQSNMPGGLAGGAVAGGLVALLLGSKTARKTATKAAKYGGAAMLGGLAYKAYTNWQQHNSGSAASQADSHTNNMAQHGHAVGPTNAFHHFEQEALEHANGADSPQSFNVALMKAMIASAKADGHIDPDEQSKISEAIEKLALEPAQKAELMELFIRPIAIDDFISDLQSMEQKAEVYLASCMVIELDSQQEYIHLSNLSKALGLPPGLEYELRKQAAAATAVTV